MSSVSSPEPRHIGALGGFGGPVRACRRGSPAHNKSNRATSEFQFLSWPMPQIIGKPTFLESHRRPTPPYVSFNTFKTLLEWLKSEGVPLRLDRSFWRAKFSGTTGTQLVAALRFLGLLSDDQPLPDLENLVKAPRDEQRVILRELLKDAYSILPFDDLDRATPSMVRQWFGTYPIDGHTLRKAISFFVNAAREAEMPMSNAVRRMAKTKGAVSYPTVANGAEKHQRSISEKIGEDVQRGRNRNNNAIKSNSTIIPLESGGVINLDISVDLFQLSERDREFVLSLVDITRNYQRRHAASSEHYDPEI